ncbi:MAG: esterase, partial [Bacteroidota bacterium]
MIPFEKFEIIPFEANDGFLLNCWRYKTKNVSKGPILLIHGAGVRANLFNPPNETNLIEMLANEGYDVWLENWRSSFEFAENQWDLDQVARNDHPAAVKLICKTTGASEIKAIIHCQGSTSFMISAALGLVPQVTTVISNAVSLHPIVSKFANTKLKYFVPVVEKITDYLNPHWGKEAPTLMAKIFKYFVKLFHWENDTNVGKFVSFTYGSGWPALWELKNLNDATKNWIQDEFGFLPMKFFRNIKQSIDKRALSPFNGKGTYADKPPKTDARFVFFAGKLNKCFSYESQVHTYKFFKKLHPGKHGFYLLADYSHLDVFFGKNA